MEHSAPQPMRVKPNFLIFGAARCGTTSVSAWLEQHPAISIPATKEPNIPYAQSVAPKLMRFNLTVYSWKLTLVRFFAAR
jgi:hypothetical protein